MVGRNDEEVPTKTGMFFDRGAALPSPRQDIAHNAAERLSTHVYN
jgi:hypothetical protein